MLKNLLKHLKNNRVNQYFDLKYVPELDGLRGIAVLAVIMFHSGVPWLRGGFIGVDIFFSLSGFLITTLLIQEYDKKNIISLKKFYLRRVIRLMPALLALLIVYILASYSLLDFNKANENLKDALIVFFYSANWTRALGMNRPTMLGHTWSLSVEEQFYILWPLLLMILLRFLASRLAIFMAIGLMTVASATSRIYMLQNGATFDRLYNGLDTRADALLVGCMLGVAMSVSTFNTLRNYRLFRKCFSLVCFLSLCLISIFGDWQSPSMYYWLFSITGISSTFLIVEAISSDPSPLKRFLKFPIFIRLGKISYGLYLWHYPIFYLLLQNKYSWSQILVLGGFISICMAACSYYFLEKPVLRLKEYFR
jgi:peptidoglycan/LPS O-acetylase OafA/YrhL